MSGATLRMRRMGIDTCHEMVAYLRSGCAVSKSEGFEAHSRVALALGARRIVATLNVVHLALIGEDEVGLSEAAWLALGGAEGEQVAISHPQPVRSMSAVRAKIYGRPLSAASAAEIVRDIVGARYSAIQTAALVTACSGQRMDEAETVALTVAMIDAGQRLRWQAPVVADKHCVGGLPGNRTSLLVVPIVAACALPMPKTSSRAITSPAGSADTMETLAPVTLDLAQMRRVVERENGCIVWGGAVSLSPADDLLIRVERSLELDSDGMLVASVLSKKIAAGSTHVLIDIPVGRTAKVRSQEAAAALGQRLERVGAALGIRVATLISDGTQPVGSGVGPALEARDVLAVLQNTAAAPADLRARSLTLAGALLELCGTAAPGAGMALAASTLASGAAWRKFQAICAAQGGMRIPPVARYTHALAARHRGRVAAVDNRQLAAVAKLAGAPAAKAAGIVFHAPLGTMVEVGQPLLTIHAESPGQLDYARAFADSLENLFTLLA